MASHIDLAPLIDHPCPVCVGGDGRLRLPVRFPHTESCFSTLPRTTRGQAIVLGGDPKGKNFLYTNGHSVIIRDIANPEISDIYTQHSAPATVAKYSPSGFYIASGDAHGKIRIWDTTQAEHILKNEFQPLGGTIKDIAWSGDSQRIAAVGDGREKFGHVFNFETGTSVGEIMGQAKQINSVDFRPSRPFRVVTASEDNTLAFFQGPPFKFNKTMDDHTRFVNCVRYSPDGAIFASGGADGKSFIYDGTSGELKCELGSPAHKGGIYGICFSADSQHLLTVSGDKTAKVWDVNANTVITEFPMGTTVDDMQVGCLWQGDFLLSVSLSGHINYLDKNNPAQPLRIIKGHNKPITGLALTEDKRTAFTAGSDGIVCHWDLNSGTCDRVTGAGHTNQVQDMAVCGDDLISCGMDDNVIFSSASGKAHDEKVKMPSQPRAVSVVSGGLVVVACVNEVVVMRNRRIVYGHKVGYEPSCTAIHPGQTQVAVGAGDGRDNGLYIYELNGDTLTESKKLTEHQGALTDLKYSPDGSMLAAADANRRIYFYRVPEYESLGSNMHTARVTSVSWTPDSQHVASGSLDTNINVWLSHTPMKNHIPVKGAHLLNQVTRVSWIDNNNLVSVGQDSCLKQWTFSYA